MRYFLLLFVVVVGSVSACGGSVEDGRSPTPTPPAGASRSTPLACVVDGVPGSGTGHGVCLTHGNYRCGADDHQVDCQCPMHEEPARATCTCSVNWKVTKEFVKACDPACKEVGPSRADLAECGIAL